MSSSKYMVQLDGLRFIAVSAVMICHWVDLSSYSYLISQLGSEGVNLFFTLSGFLISGILMSNKAYGTHGNAFILKQFYFRRSIRIFPLYYLILFIGLVVWIPALRTYFWWFLTYTANYIVGITKGEQAYFTHLWSLAVEEQFYILFPLVLLLTPKKYYKALFVVLTVLALLSRVFIFLILSDIDQALWCTYTFTPSCLDAFAIGALLAYLNLFEKDSLKKLIRPSWFYLIILVFAVLMQCIKPKTTLTVDVFNGISNRLFISIFSFWLIGRAALRDFVGLFGKFLENQVVNYLGRITYGIYVFHHFMPYIFMRMGFPDNSVIKLFYFPLTVIIASTSWFLFEKPLNSLKRFFEYR